MHSKTQVFILVSHLHPGYFSNKYELALERVSRIQSPTGTAFVPTSLPIATCPLAHTVSCTMVATVVSLRKQKYVKYSCTLISFQYEFKKEWMCASTAHT
jgi:hypothetical protein